ncbi:T9SS type A sorting domain-containing protein [Chitinophagaceae bacterium MMS25-I14]
MKKILCAVLFVLAASRLHAADYYWIGGGGNWSDLNHWRLGSSTGAIPSIVPSTADNVFFDANSGFGTTTATKTVTLDANGFCNNMNWAINVPNSPRFVMSNTAFTLEIWGNASLAPTTTYNVALTFKGSTANTFTSNGTVLGELGMQIDKSSGSLTVADSLVQGTFTNSTGNNQTVLTSGTLNIAGKKLYGYQFYSQNTNTRTLEMTNADVNYRYQYRITGTGKTVNGPGSTLTAQGYFYTDGGTYNKVTATVGSTPGTFSIDSTTFTSIFFTQASSASGAALRYGNTVTDSLVFLGAGRLFNNNTVAHVRFAMQSNLMGTGNIIGTMMCQDNFQVTGNFTNTVDTLLLAANHTSTFDGTFNINKYLFVDGAPCEAFTEIDGDTTNGSINFASGAAASLSYVILTGVEAYGPNTPITVDGIDGGGNIGFTITPPASVGSTTLYWVGGSGDWNDRTHWSAASGGAGGACVPFTGDDVIFDGNSGLATGTVTTSSSSFCHNMTWTNVGTVTFSESATSSFRMYGSIVMDSSVTMNATIELPDTTTATITTNGSTHGTLQFTVEKTGTGSVTLADDWNNPTGGRILHQSGGFKMPGRTVNIDYYWSNTALARSLDITNATINVTSRWDYRFANRTLAATGSHITSQYVFATSGPVSVSYPWVDLTYGGTLTNIFAIDATTFGQLTFTSALNTSSALISSNNTIRRLEYKGAGVIGGGNSIDTLILAGSRIYTFGTGINNINKYLRAQATPCTGLTEIHGNAPATLNFASGAVADVANVYMQNMTATGPITPIAFSGADAGGNTGWTISAAAGGPRYWVGGSGDWNNNTHWSTTSGGANGACIPTVYDDVYFDANSGFTSGSKTVTISNGNAYAHNVNWTGALSAVAWSKSASFNMEVWGDSLIINPADTFSVSPLTVKGANITYTKGGAPLGNFDITIDKTGAGGLTMLNNFSNAQTNIELYNGAWNASGVNLNILQVDNSLALNNVFAVNISNSTINTPFGWRFQGTIANHTLNATHSSITTSDFKANGMTYDTVNATGTLTTSVNMTSTTINRLTFTDPSTASAVGVVGAGNTLGRVEYKGGGVITGSNTIDTLIFFPGGNYTLTAGTNTTITGDWYGSGTPCHLTQIYSSSTTANATVTKTSGNVQFDYVRLRRITAAGAAAPFSALSHTDNQGNNTNWNIAAYNGAAPIYGLGPDTAVHTLPLTLHTDGFFGSPSSQYLWNNGSTADSLVAVDSGTYSVNVSFVDGCNISDQIHIALLAPLSLTLTGFNAQVQHCQSVLNWKVADVKDFSHFVIESSNDGKIFYEIGSVPYTAGLNEYTYTDKSVTSGTTYYRLRLTDRDGSYKYSSVVSVYSDCNVGTIRVFPTVATNTLQVALPNGYEHAAFRIMNVAGMLVTPGVQGSESLKKINLQDLPAASYLLQVINNKEVQSFRFIKQ